MKSTLLLIIGTLFFYSSTQAQITFSDPNLKAALIGLSLDKNSNTEIEINEVDTLKRLYVNNKAINSFNDLIHFPALERLYCAGNKMNDLDLSHNLQLKYLQAAGMDLNFIDLSKNLLLDTLEIFNNKLIAIDISTNTNLTSINCNNNQLTSLDLSLNTQLQHVALSQNFLTSLNTSTLLNLKRLFCDENINLTTLNLLNNSQLEILVCINNSMDELILSGNPMLISLSCGYNSLYYIGLKNQTNLKELSAQNNNLQAIDFSANTKLTSLNLNNNNFSSIDLMPIVSLSNLQITGNPSLLKICINDTTSAKTNVSFFKDASAKYNSCDYLEFKDPNFKANLLAYTNPIIDVNKDGEIQISEVDTLRNLEINGSLQGTPIISDVSELIYFKQLKSISLTNHNLSSLSEMSFDSLSYLNCTGNKITNLNLNLYPSLQTLSCGSNNIIILNLSACKNLQLLNASANKIESLDLLSNTKLTHIYISNNNLSTLDVSNLQNLLWLSASNNFIKKIYVTNSINLIDINVNDNQIDSIDVSTNINLQHLKCNNNLVSYLKPVSSLTELALLNNMLANKLDISMITNAYNIDLRANTALKYVCVNNRTNFSNNGSYRKDITAKWLDQCDFIIFTDTTLKHYLVVNNYDLNLDGEIQYSEAEMVKTLDFSHADISELEGLDKLINLESLLLNDNKFDNILLGTLTKLKNLVLTNNNLSNIDITQNTALQSLDIKHNNLNTLEIGNQTSLETLDCSQNKLTALTLNSNLNLKSLLCYANNLTGLDLTFNSNLAITNCDTNNISALNIQANPSLNNFSCRANPGLSSVCVDSFDVVKSSPNFNKDPHTQWTDYCNVNPRLASSYSYCVNQWVDTTVFPLTKKSNTIKWYSDQDALVEATINTSKIGDTSYYIAEYNPITHKVSKRNIVMLTITNREAAPMVNPINICLNTVLSTGITPTLGLGYSARWYADETSNDTIAAPKPVTTTIDTIPYYFTQYKGTSCESFRAKIDVIINPLPEAPTINSLSTYCHQAVPQQMLADPLCQLQWWNSEQNGIMNQQYQPSTSVIGLTSYYVNQKNTSTGCEGPRIKIQFEVIPSPSKPTFSFANYTQQYVNDSITSFKSSISIGAIKYKWIISPSGAATTTDTTNKVSLKWNTAYSGNTSVKVVSISNNGCLSDTSSHVSITKVGVAKLSVDKPNLMLFLNDTATIQLALTGAAPFNISYTYAGKDTSIANYSSQLYTLKVITPGAISDIIVLDSSKVILQNIGNPFTLISDTLTRIELSKIQTVCKNAPSKLIVHLTGGRAPFTCYLEDTISGYKTQHQIEAADTVAIRAGAYKITFEDATQHLSSTISILVADSINQDFAILKTILTSAGFENDSTVINSKNVKSRLFANVDVKDLSALYHWSISPSEAIISDETESSDNFIKWNRHFSGKVKVAVQGYKFECKTQTSDTLKFNVKPNVELEQINDSLVKFNFYGTPPYSVHFRRDDRSDSIQNSYIDSVFVAIKFAKNIEIQNVTANNTFNNTSNNYINKSYKKIKFYDGISPNNDGKNDYFMVDYYDLERTSNLTIFTYDGFKMFSSKGDHYLNDWNGVDEQGNPLPSCSYLFIFKTDKETIRGSFEIRR